MDVQLNTVDIIITAVICLHMLYSNNDTIDCEDISLPIPYLTPVQSLRQNQTL